MSSTRRRKRPDLIGRRIDARARLFTGILAMLPFLMLDHLTSRAILAALFAIAAVLSGKRIRWIYFAVLTFSITFFHLLAPIGRVLFEFGPFTITAGALENGLGRSLTLIGMVFLSLAAVRPELELPGRFGSLLARTFYYFEVVLDGKARLSRKDFFLSLDKLLLERFNPEEEDFGHGRRTAAGKSRQTDERTGNGEQIINKRRHGVLPALIFLAIPWTLWMLELLNIQWT